MMGQKNGQKEWSMEIRDSLKYGLTFTKGMKLWERIIP
jgi:hypothetical protein